MSHLLLPLDSLAISQWTDAQENLHPLCVAFIGAAPPHQRLNCHFLREQGAQIYVDMSRCCMCAYLEYLDQDKSSRQLLTLTGSVMDSWLSNPGEMSEISGSRGLEGRRYSAAVDSRTAISSSSS